MTTWKLFYENRFPRQAVGRGTIFDLHRAPAGSQEIASGFVFVLFTGFSGLGIGDGRHLTYRPEAPLEKVIGLDVSAEIGIITLFQQQPLNLFSTGPAGLSATLEATEPPTQDGHTCRLSLRLDDSVTTIEGIRFRQRLANPQPEGRLLQARWTTHGQLHVWLDGLLVGYENVIAPGHSFDLDRLSIGDVERPMTGVVNAAIRGFRLVELREHSAASTLGAQLAPERLPEVSERCGTAARDGVETLLRRARALMAEFNRSQTAPWRKGDPGRPFSADAVTAHRAGTRAGEAFARYLREGSSRSRLQAVSHLGDLLGILARDQPARFRQLLADSRELRAALEEYCAEESYEIRAENPELFAKLDPLSTEIEEILEGLEGEYT